jgi:hypothetical protein
MTTHPLPLRLRATLAALCMLLAAGAAAARAPADSARAIRADVEFLADDRLEGRLAETRGYEIAARYVAAQFAALGLRPGGTDGRWFQDVPLVESAAVIPAARLTLFPAGGGQAIELTSAEDFLPSADAVNADVTIRAPLVFAGFGISAPERQYDDLAAIDLRGRIAVVLSGAPSLFPPDVRAHYAANTTKLPVLLARGAVGVLQVQTPVDQKRVPWARIVQQSWRPSMRWARPDGTVDSAWPELRARAALSPDAARRLFAAAPRTIDEVYAAAEAGRPQAFELPFEAELTRRSVIGRKSSENVIALLPGSDPVLRNEYVVLTAHLDHVGRGAPVAGDSIYNGAFDNASGIAVMLETARMLSARGRAPRRSVLFVAVTAEESGLLGSDYFAEYPTVPRERIVANLNMDMPVMLGPVADLVAFGAEHSTLGAVAARAARAEGFTLSPDPMPEETIFVRSDQYSFVKRGIPALYLDSGKRSRDPAIDQKQRYEAFLRERYHQPGDDLSQPIDYGSLSALARVNARITTTIGNERRRPSWNPDSFFRERFAR